MSDPTSKRSTPLSMKDLMSLDLKTTSRKPPPKVDDAWVGPPAQLPKGSVNDVRKFITSGPRSGAVAVAMVHGNQAVLACTTDKELSELFRKVGFVPPKVFKHPNNFVLGVLPFPFFRYLDMSCRGTHTYDLMREANATYAFCSGNMQSLVQRFVDNIGKRPVFGELAEKTAEVVVAVLVSVTKRRSLPSTKAEYLDSYVIKNPSASDGLPFQAPHVYSESSQGDLIVHPIRASRMLAELVLSHCYSQSSLVQYLKQHSWLTTVLMSPKQEAYKRSELWQEPTWAGLEHAKVKTRAVFTWPGWIQVAVGPVFQALQRDVPTFVEDPESPNAIGFSWVRGGAEKLVNHFLNLEVGKESVLIYGDDCLYGRRVEGGVIFFAPDVSAMDLSMHSAHARVLLKVLQALYASAPPEILTLLSVYSVLMVNAPILLETLILEAKSGLRSGGPGTSWLDSIASMMVYAAYGIKKSKGEVRHFETLAPAIAKELGLKYKESTLGIHEFREGDRTLGVTFLGAEIVYVDTPHGSGWIPRRSDEDTAKSLVAPKIVSKTERHHSVELGRLAALYAWGLWAEQDSELKRVFLEYTHRFTDELIIESVDKMLPVDGISAFPSDAWYAELLWGEGAVLPDTMSNAEEDSEEEEAEPAKFSWADQFTEMLNEEAVKYSPRRIKPEYKVSGPEIALAKRKAHLATQPEPLPKKAIKPRPSWDKKGKKASRKPRP